MRSPIRVNRDLVLIGGGHSHVTVIRQLAMQPIPGLRVTLISRDALTPYSGMLPGLIAGHYRREQCYIDLRRLCQWAGVRLFVSELTELDVGEQRACCDDRPAVRYDTLSINIGSSPAIGRIDGARETGVAVKPVDIFLAALNRWSQQAQHAARPQVLAVVGGGAAAVELVLALQYRLQQARTRFRLISASQALLPTHNRRVAGYFKTLLAQRGIELTLDCAVTQAEPGLLRGNRGQVIAADFVVWAIHAGAPSWIAASGLAVDDVGFMQVTDTLQSSSHAHVFGAGDCIHLLSSPLPKSGVHAVRQGPMLAGNIRRQLLDKRLRRYRPQRHFLSLLATGDQRAVASRGQLFAAGSWVWRWKSRVDQRFMQRFNDLPPAMTTVEAGEHSEESGEFRCGGCGAKVAGSTLQQVLDQLGDGNTGGAHFEDAALIDPPAGKQLVQTIDHFRAFIDDPYLFGKIAANHCLGDIYAMGAQPLSALALANIPYSAPEIMADTLQQLMQGAVHMLAQAQTTLLGGHSAEAAELAFGLTVNGCIDPGQALLKSGLREGQVLVLTKALGTGTLLAAHMRHLARADWVDAALYGMLQSSAEASVILRRHGATACTDITGFGLLGHLLEMLRASDKAAELKLDALPLLPGAVDCLSQGIVSSLQAANREQACALSSAQAKGPLVEMLYDPQTAGGLLAGIPEAHATDCVAALTEAGYNAAAVGRIQARAGAGRVLLL